MKRSVLHGFPWVALVLTGAPAAWSQATVGDDPSGQRNRPVNPIAAAARDRRSISLSSEQVAPTETPGLTPEFHTVERGDTLWDITGRYFDNPWRWPDVWGLNAQITNPHWIFPGDQVRLLRPEDFAREAVALPRSRQTLSNGDIPQAPRVAPRVPAQTVFLRDQGWLDREDARAAGTIAGSPEDQMLLSEGDHAYVEFHDRTPRVGESYTIYEDAQPATHSDHNAGHVVRILGTVRVESYNADHHIADVRVTESLDGIERGQRVAAIPRRFETVPPAQNAVELRGHIVASVQPRELVGQNMVVFFDRGSDQGVRRGNRLFVLRRGDAWRHSLTTTADRAVGTGIDRNGDGIVDDTPDRPARERDLPEEIVGELQVLDVRAGSATCLVTSAVTEVEVGDIVEMRRGY